MTFPDYLRHQLGRSPLTISAYCNDIEQFRRFIAPLPLEEGSTADVREWLAFLAESESPRTLRRKTQSLRAFFKFLMATGQRDSNPAANIILAKTDRPLPEYVRIPEMESLLQLLREEALKGGSADDFAAYLCVDFLYSTGARQAELLTLSDTDIDTRAGLVKVTGKRNKQRILPLPPPLCREIEEYRKLRNAEYPREDFPERPFIILRGKALTKSQLYRTVRTALDSVSSHKKSPHVLRHTFATAMLSGGAGIESVKEFLGHESVATTQIYTHVSMTELKKTYSMAHPRAKKR